MSESVPSQNPAGWKTPNLALLIIVTCEKVIKYNNTCGVQSLFHLCGNTVPAQRIHPENKASQVSYTSCAHQAQLG